MKTILLAALLLLSVACGQATGRPTGALVSPSASPAASSSTIASAAPTALASPSGIPTPIATPKTSPTLLFAVLEAKGTANAWTYNTVAIAGLDGYARAKTTFTPMPLPQLGCMGAVLPSQAHVAAGKVFFADGKGVVRSLATDGTVTTVASFPMTSTQQMLSFAVSPDGSRILGTILTIPNNASMACSSSPSSAAFTFDAYAATSGQAVKLVYHESSTQPPSVMALTGWDALGPIGTYPTVWATQGGGPAATLGILVRIDESTMKMAAPMGDSTPCLVWQSVQSGAFVCTLQPKPTSSDPYGAVAQPVSVRQADGREKWSFTVTSVNGANSPYLAPDEQHVVICCNFDTASNWLVDQQGHQSLFKTGFYASGWLDAGTVFGFSGQTASSPAGVLSYVAISSPGTIVSMGFSGLIVGTVRS